MKVRRPTISSDCYSLGMVIYEVISGKPPFYEDVELMACMKVLSGERPLREEGFADILWRILEKCWMSQLNDRPSVEDVLHCLEACSSPLPPPSPGMYNRIEVDLGFDGEWSSSPASCVPSENPIQGRVTTRRSVLLSRCVAIVNRPAPEFREVILWASPCVMRAIRTM